MERSCDRPARRPRLCAGGGDRRLRPRRRADGHVQVDPQPAGGAAGAAAGREAADAQRAGRAADRCRPGLLRARRDHPRRPRSRAGSRGRRRHPDRRPDPPHRAARASAPCISRPCWPSSRSCIRRSNSTSRWRTRSSTWLPAAIDLAVRIGNLANSSLIARRIAPVRGLLLASPAYLAERGRPAHPRDLARHDLLLYGYSEQWRFRVGDRWEHVRGRPRLRANNGEMLREAACAGLGICILPSFIAAPAHRGGRAGGAAARLSAGGSGAHAVMPPGRATTARVRALVDHLAARFGPEPAWDPCWLARRRPNLDGRGESARRPAHVRHTARSPLAQSAQPPFRCRPARSAASASASRVRKGPTSRNIASARAGSASPPAAASTATASR